MPRGADAVGSRSDESRSGLGAPSANARLRPQERILGAAEQCFARAGFAGASMNDIALAAGMSPGNLYRYFPSKAAITATLVERAQRELELAFQDVCDPDGFLVALSRSLEGHLGPNARHRAALAMEIWAEASRNEEIKRICRAMEERVCTLFGGILEAAKTRGAIAQDVNVGLIVRCVATFASGLFKRCALEDDFTARAEIPNMLAIIQMLSNPRR